MQIRKRNGKLCNFNINQITYRLRKLCKDKVLGNVLKNIDIPKIVQRVKERIRPHMTTSEIDEISALLCVEMYTEHIEYGELASRIIISNMHKNTHECFSNVMEILYENVNYGKNAPLVSEELINIVRMHKDELDFMPEYSRDYLFDYFGYKTLEKAYLLRIHLPQGNFKIVERPQHMWMRVAIGIHGDNLEAVRETYEMLSQKYFIHATPTLFNAGTPRPQLSSCFEENTLIHTFSGYKKIKDVQIGDEVITHTGKRKRVMQLHKNPLNGRQMYLLECDYTPAVKVTGNHKLYVMKKGNNQPEWISVGNLTKDHYVALPNYPGEKANYDLDISKLLNCVQQIDERMFSFDITDTKIYPKTRWISRHLNDGQQINVSRKHNEINRFWKIDNEFARFLGIFYGDGHIIRNKNYKNGYACRGLGITAHSENSSLIKFVTEYGEKLFGIESTIHTQKGQNCIQILFNSTIIGCIFDYLFGHGFAGKKLWNEMYEWRTELIYDLLSGLISTDGCITAKTTIVLQLSNTEILTNLYHLCRSHGIVVSYLKSKYRSPTASADSGRLCIYPLKQILENVYKTYTDDRIDLCIQRGEDEKYTFETADGSRNFVKITNITKISDTPEYVYTLGVEDDHSYSVEGLIAENCFLYPISEDSIDGIFETVKHTAITSKWAGGIGLSIHNIRAKGTVISGTNGVSNGLVPMLQVFNRTACYVDQGGGKRQGSFAIYLEPWHADIIPFLQLKKKTGDDEARARDLFYAMWVPDLFMKQVRDDGPWYLMCPHECPGLSEVYGDEFEALYWKYVSEGKYREEIKARDLMEEIVVAQIETGTPYMVYKDIANRKSNQKNLGTLKSSNLCSEIFLYNSEDEYAVCNLATLALPAFIEKSGKNGEIKTFNFEKLAEITKLATRNLNKVIDRNFYPLPQMERSNKTHRPIGIGIQGLADAYYEMGWGFDYPEAAELNKQIAETMYYAALEESCRLAEIHGPYATFRDSPASQGILQFDMWGIDPTNARYNWAALKERIQKVGLYNSELIALPPTASTSQILGNNECFEPYTNNIYSRRTNAGNFMIVNKHLVKDLMKSKLWNVDMKNVIIAQKGSIQNIDSIPQELKNKYKTVWEIQQKVIIDQARDRGAYCTQGMSMNLFLPKATIARVSSMLMYGWQQGLKTGLYYLRSKAAVEAKQFTIDANDIEKKLEEMKRKAAELREQESEEKDKKKKKTTKKEEILEEPEPAVEEGPVCTMEEGCITCSS